MTGDDGAPFLILMVDCDAATRAATETVLGDAGYRVRTTGGFHQAGQLLASTHI